MKKINASIAITFTEKTLSQYATTYPILTHLETHPVKLEGDTLNEIGNAAAEYLNHVTEGLTAIAKRNLRIYAINGHVQENEVELTTFITYLTVDDFYSNLIVSTSYQNEAAAETETIKNATETQTEEENNEDTMADFTEPEQTNEAPVVTETVATPAPKARRKRRTKAEIEADKLAKEQARTSVATQTVETKPVPDATVNTHEDPMPEGLLLDEEPFDPAAQSASIMQSLAAAVPTFPTAQTETPESPITQMQQEPVVPVVPTAPITQPAPSSFVIEQPAQPTISIAQPTYLTTATNAALIDKITQRIKATPTEQLEFQKVMLLTMLSRAIINPNDQPNDQFGLLIETQAEFNALMSDYASILGAFDYIIHG